LLLAASACAQRTRRLLRTHPMTADRVAAVREALPAAFAVYRSSDCAGAGDLFALFDTFVR